jgi:iron complex outermembrane receptor protein
MKVRLSTVLMTSCAAAALSALSNGAAAQQADASKHTSSTVQEVVVTAERRETNQQTTPVAVTALTPAVIASNRVHTLADLNNLAPGLQAQVSGSLNTVVYNLRGVTSTAYLPGQSSGVSTYVDGVYLGTNAGKITDLSDIDRIEVLRGPQGTLFGRNSNGGAISITTKLPTGKFDVSEELSGGNFDEFRSRTRLDLPEWNDITASITYLHDQQRGDIRNLGAGTQWDWGPVTQGKWGIRTSPKWLGGHNTDGGAVVIRYKPNSQFDLVLRGDASSYVYSDRGNAILGDPNNINGTFPFGVLPYYLAVPASQRSPITTTWPSAVNNFFVTPVHQLAWGTSLTGTYHLNDMVTFKNILAYRSVNLDTNTQLDAAAGGNTPIPGIPFTIQSSASQNNDHDLTEEFQTFITTKWVQLTVGAFYYDGTISNGPAVNPGDCASGACIAATGTQPYVIANAGQLRSQANVTSLAFYGQAKIQLTDRFDISLGGRNTQDKSTGDDNLSGVTFHTNYQHSHANWLVGADYKLADQVFAYAKMNTGYISGGQFAGFNYAPETVLSYEGGVKADWLDRTLRTNLAVYDAIYSNLQAAGLIPGAGPNGGGLTVVLNTGGAHIRGAEFEGTWVPPIEGLTLSGSVSYADFEYKNFNPLYLLFNGLTPANVLSTTPKWSGNAAMQYRTPDTYFGGHGLARVDFNYRGGTNLSTVFHGQSERDAQHVDARVLINARVGLTEIPVQGGHVEVALWAQNLTDNRDPISALFIGYYTAQYQQPRTYGIDLYFDY